MDVDMVEKKPLDKQKVTFTILGAIGLIGFLMMGTWVVARYASNLENKINYLMERDAVWEDFMEKTTVYMNDGRLFYQSVDSRLSNIETGIADINTRQATLEALLEELRRKE
jgi:hypothetical protein